MRFDEIDFEDEVLDGLYLQKFSCFHLYMQG